MMKKIKPDEITNNLTHEQLEILADMLGGDTLNNGWLECYKKLSDEQIFQVHNKLGELTRKREEFRVKSLTDEERSEEKRKSDEWYKKAQDDPDGFYGNMSRPEYPE